MWCLLQISPQQNLLGNEYGPDEVKRYVSYKAYPTDYKRLFLLKRSLYGQRDAPHRWWSTLTEWLESQGFVPGSNDSCMYHYPVHKDGTVGGTVGGKKGAKGCSPSPNLNPKI